jgi:hypothetical protein
MPIVHIPGLATRSTTIEVYQPALTQDDPEVILDRFELGANEIRENYNLPTPYGAYRYRDESLEELQGRDTAAKSSPGEAKLLPHMQAEGEAGQKRLGEVTPAVDAVEQQQRDEGIQTAAMIQERWGEDVERVKNEDLTVEDASLTLLRGRGNRTQKDMVAVDDSDYEGSGESKQASARKAGKDGEKAQKARQKAQERRHMNEGSS